MHLLCSDFVAIYKHDDRLHEYTYYGPVFPRQINLPLI